MLHAGAMYKPRWTSVQGLWVLRAARHTCHAWLQRYIAGTVHCGVEYSYKNASMFQSQPSNCFITLVCLKELDSWVSPHGDD